MFRNIGFYSFLLIIQTKIALKFGFNLKLMFPKKHYISHFPRLDLIIQINGYQMQFI